MSLKRIPTDVEKKISGSSDIKSFTKAVEELVFNAFDAKSTSIAVRVFIQEGSIQVVDNGTGITEKDFQFLGHRYYTSKLRSELNSDYGYRGLSLASIVEVSQKVKITSKYHENTECTFTKSFVEGKEQEITKTSTRPSKGTTVNVSGFLYNFHIQKNSTNATTELSHIKTFLERVSLAHCNTSISLRDDSINDIIFQINKHRDISQTLQTLYQIRSQDIEELQVEKHDYKIHGFIEKTIEGDRNYHFIYVNGRFIRSSKLQSSIDKRLKSYNYNRVMKTKYVFDETTKALNKSTPFYFIFIKCPHNDYDISYNNEETFIEFKNWEKIDKLVEKLIKFYKGDLKAKEISNDSCKKNGRIANEDTRKRVKQIVQKFLDNSTKRPKRLQLRTGIIGKNATRKDNRKSEKLSISKIVSKKFKSRLKEFYENNPPKNNLNKFLSIEHTIKEPDVPMRKKVTGDVLENINDIYLKQNNIDVRNCKKKPNILKTSQDSLNKKFKKPTDSILQRCDMMLDGLKETLVPDKASRRNDHNNFEYATSKTVETQIDFRFISHSVTKNQALIKTSYDLIKTIFNCGDATQFNFSREKNKNKNKTRLNNSMLEYYAVKKYYNDKISSENIGYSKESPPRKRKRFITEKSCDNFHTLKTIRTNKQDCGNEKYKKDTRNKRQVIKHRKAKLRNFYHKNKYTEQSLHTIETFESHICRNKAGSIFEPDRSYVSHKGHKFINEKLTSKVEKYDANIVLHKDNITKYDFHKTFTIQIAESNKYYSHSDIKTNFSNLSSDKIFTKNNNWFLSPNPLDICETVFRTSTSTNKDYKRYSYGNVSIESNGDINPKYYNDNNGLFHCSLISEGNKCLDLEQTRTTNNINITENSNIFRQEQNEAINLLSICESVFQNSVADNNNIFGNSFYNIDLIKNKEEYIQRQSGNDDGVFNHFINGENNSLLDNITVRDKEHESNKSNFFEQSKTPCTLSIFETKLLNRAEVNNISEVDSNDYVGIKDTKNYGSRENIDHNRIFQYSINENNKRLLATTPIKTRDINTSNKASKQEDIKDTMNDNLPCKVNIHSDDISFNDFKITSRHNFVPKGMSQITEIQRPKITQLDAQGDLEGNYYDTDIYDNFATNLQNFSEVLLPGVQVIKDLDIKGIRHVLKPSSNDPLFNNQSLKEAKVIGQVDNKFIGAKVTVRYAKTNKSSVFLVLFDQHAVDERIRLENNLADYIDGDTWNGIPIDALPIKVPKDVVAYLHNYKDKFTRFGLEWTCNGDVVSIKCIPKAIFGKNSRPTDVIMKAVKNLILEEVEAIKSLKGNVSLHPKSIMDLVLSEACRYAIKFGDILRKNECEVLLSELSKCKLPFQCAHGRPVMAVLMELPTASIEYEVNMDSLKRMKPKLSKYSM